jgi:hypothetical protein
VKYVALRLKKSTKNRCGCSDGEEAVKICYIDESGCTGTLPSATSNIQPVLAIAGIVLDYSALHLATEKLLEIKGRFYPSSCNGTPRYLDSILQEIKGSDLRKQATCYSRSTKRHAIGVIDNILKLCEEANAKLVGRVWVKQIGGQFCGLSVYTYSMQSIYNDFQNLLAQEGDTGLVIVDSRVKHLNTPVAHAIFTQKFKSSGDNYDRILELPAFSHSENHAGLQLADKLCSALIFPLAVHSYCEGHIQSVHIRPGYADLKQRYGLRLRALQHRYQEANGRWRGGLVVADSLTRRPGRHLFE